MTTIADQFPRAKGYATEANAMRAQDRAALLIEDANVMTTIAQRADGRWLVVCQMGPDSRPNIPALASRGICITNEQA